jgi:GT2 family glycosyltransferase
MNISVLMTCFNRKEKTLKCLAYLYNQNKLNDIFTIDTFLVDDGSTDGTASSVKELFPQVKVIKGTGNLYWNRGMHLAWINAAKNKEYDYFMLLNDDTFLKENAVYDLLQYQNKNSVVSGSTQNNENSQEFSYGGFRNKVGVIPNGEFQHCDYTQGNILLISKIAFQTVGFIDPIYHHAFGDYDYTLRAKKLGVDVVIGPNWSGYCEKNVIPQIWINADKLTKRIKHYYSPLSGHSPVELFIFDIRHYGIKTAAFHLVTNHLRTFFPKTYSKYLAIRQKNKTKHKQNMIK